MNDKCKKVIRKALKALGKKNFAVIMHNGSFPALNNENTGFGTIIPVPDVSLSNMPQDFLTLYNSGLQVKLKAVTLHLIQVRFSQQTRCLLT